jgi:hypothetical protein
LILNSDVPIEVRMKKIIFIISGLLAQSLLAQSASKCEPVNELLKNTTSVKAVACEEINKNGRCEEAVPVDKDAIRKAIEADLNFTTNPSTITRLQGNWDGFIKANPRFQKFYAERSRSDQDKKTAPVPILDWFSDPEFASSVKTSEEYRKAFIEKYVAFAEKYDCKPTFYAGANHIEPHPTIKEFSTAKMGREEKERRLAQMKKELNDPVNIQAVTDRMKSLGESSLNSFRICTTRPDLDSQGQIRGLVRTALLYPPCAGNFTQNFENNKYDVSETELSKLLETKEAQDVSACIKSRLAQGAKIHHISISSSASALNNTQEAKKRFCEKGFLGLSEARAETARHKILPGLFSRAEKEGFDFSKVKIETNALGANGDGTSGDCPYTYTKSGQEILKPYYNTKAGLQELDENRFVKVQVTFEDATKRVSESIPHYQPMYRCKKIDLKCE